MAEQTIGSTKGPIGTGVGIICAFIALLFAGLFVFSLLDLTGAHRKPHAETFVFFNSSSCPVLWSRCMEGDLPN
jgi:hypothetical protein